MKENNMRTHTRTQLFPIVLAASVGVTSLLAAACYDYTITTSLDPTLVAACQGSSQYAPCLWCHFSPSLKSCHSGPERTNRTCAHTKTENITWYEFLGSCQLQDGTLTCIANDVRGPYTMYNFDQWEARLDPNCSLSN